MAGLNSTFSLGLVATGKRSIRSGEEFNRFFSLGELKGTDPVVRPRGSNFDTLGEMKKIVRETLHQTAKLADHLYDADRRQFAQNIWDFVYHHIQYKKDSPLFEEIREPARSWKDRRAGVDCDCYSVFVSSILTNKKIPHAFRMAGYDGGDYQHVYVVVPAEDNNYSDVIIIDPVVDAFDYEVPPTKTYDYKMLPIKRLNGIGSDGGSMSLAGPLLGSVFSGAKDYGKEFSLNGFGDISTQYIQFISELRNHLANTIAMVQANPQVIAPYVGNVDEFQKKINLILSVWNNPESLMTTLSNLANQESNLSEPGFFTVLYKGIQAAQEAPEATDINGLGKNIFEKFRDNVLKPIGDVIRRFNPVSIALRSSVEVFLKENLLNVAFKSGYGFLTKTQKDKLGVSDSAWKTSMAGLDKLSNVYQKILGGKPDQLKKFVLHGWRKGLANKHLPGAYPHGLTDAEITVTLKSLTGLGSAETMSFSGLGYLGEPVSATVIIGSVSGVLSSVLVFLGKIKDDAFAPQSAVDPEYATSDTPVFDDTGVTSTLMKYAPWALLGVGALVAGIAIFSGGSKKQPTIIITQPAAVAPEKSLSGVKKSRKAHKAKPKATQRKVIAMTI